MKFSEYVEQQEEQKEAFLINDGGQSDKTKDDYIVDAEEGVVVAFRLNFTAKSGVELTKVISGKILENNNDEQGYVVETRNGLKYGVPYNAVVWVKTGQRWPKGVYEEMKQGSVERNKKSEYAEFGELDTSNNDFGIDDEDAELNTSTRASDDFNLED